MKILSKRHPARVNSLVVVDELPFTGLATQVEGGGFFYCPYIPKIAEPQWTHIEIKPKSALDCINVPALVNTINSYLVCADETKITDFGDGNVTIEMWMHR
jgi:hypothetical protein